MDPCFRRGRRRSGCNKWRAAHMRGKLRRRSGRTRYTDDKDTIYAQAVRAAFRQRESGREALPRERLRRVICIEIIRRRGIGHVRDADIAETVDREQCLDAGTFVPAGEAQQVPDQPWPEERPDMLEVGSEARMHGGNLGAGDTGGIRGPGSPVLIDGKRWKASPHSSTFVIPAGAKRSAGTQLMVSQVSAPCACAWASYGGNRSAISFPSAGSRISPAACPG